MMAHTESATQAAVTTAKKPTMSENMACMRAMGVRKFIPLPHGCQKWQRFKQWPLVVRLWAWMVSRTVEWPILNPYAVMVEAWDADTGRPIYAELHIENAAESLGIDEANARKAWRLGCRMGLWGNRPHKDNEGDKYLGRRRMYFYGDIDLARAEQEAGKPEPDEDHEKRFVQTFSPAIWQQIKDRPKQEIEVWLDEEEGEKELATILHADLIAAYRLFITQREDNRWAARGVKVNRQEHHFKNGHAAAHSERQAAVQAIYAPVLLPLLAEAATKRFVRTSSESVQGQKPTPSEVPHEVSTAPASLLGQKEPENYQILVPTSDVKRACGSVKTPPVNQRVLPNLQYTGRTRQEPTETRQQPAAELKPEEQEAIDLLFTKTREYQNKFPHTKFGSDLVDPANKADRVWSGRVLELVTPAGMEGFCYDVGVRLGLMPNSLGKLPRPNSTPAHNPHERYIGLIVEWAADWKRNAPERAKAYQEERERKARVEERMRQANEAAARQAEEWQRVETAWDELASERREALIRQAKEELKADPAFMSFRNTPPATREAAIQRRAKQALQKTMVRKAGA